MNKTLKRALLIAGGVVAACGIVWGGLTLARNAQRGNVNVYAVSDFSMSDYWGDTSQTSGTVSTDKVQKIYLSDTQKINNVYVEEGQSVKKGDKLLSYDTTLTSLDIERAQIAYEKEKLALETAKQDLERLKLAFDKDALEDEIDSLNKKIDRIIAENIKKWRDETNRDVLTIKQNKEKNKDWTAEPITKDGNGTKEAPLYYHWHTDDELTAENLLELVPKAMRDAAIEKLKSGGKLEDLKDDQKTVYVVLVIHEDNKTLGSAYSCGLRLTLDQAETPKQEGAATGSAVSGNALTGQEGQDIILLTHPEGNGDGEDNTGGEEENPVKPEEPAAQPEEVKLTVRMQPANLPGASIEEIDGVNDEVRKLRQNVEVLTELLSNSYTQAELIQMEKDKLKEIAGLDVTIKLAKLNLEQVKKEVGNDTVYSELDGTIKAVRDPNGADFDKSQAVVEVSGGGGFYIDGAISELELGTVSVGEKVQVNSWMTGASCEGEIVEISDYPTDNASSWSDGNSNVSYYPFKVFVSEEAELREGDYVDMSYQNTVSDDGGNALYLESMFIRTENGKSYVLARGEDGRLEQRWVQTGRNLWGSYTQIRGGLTAEDFVAFPYGRNVTAGAATTEATPDQLYNGM